MLLESIVAFMISALAFGVLAAGVFGGIRADQTTTLYQEALSLARSHLSGAEADTRANRRRRERLHMDGSRRDDPDSEPAVVPSRKPLGLRAAGYALRCDCH